MKNPLKSFGEIAYAARVGTKPDWDDLTILERCNWRLSARAVVGAYRRRQPRIDSKLTDANYRGKR